METCHHFINRLVKNGLEISVTEGGFSSEATTVINSSLQLPQCQRSWISRLSTRSSHSRLTILEPQRGHFSPCRLETDAMLTFSVYFPQCYV